MCVLLTDFRDNPIFPARLESGILAAMTHARGFTELIDVVPQMGLMTLYRSVVNHPASGTHPRSTFYDSRSTHSHCHKFDRLCASVIKANLSFARPITVRSKPLSSKILDWTLPFPSPFLIFKAKLYLAIARLLNQSETDSTFGFDSSCLT